MTAPERDRHMGEERPLNLPGCLQLSCGTLSGSLLPRRPRPGKRVSSSRLSHPELSKVPQQLSRSSFFSLPHVAPLEDSSKSTLASSCGPGSSPQREEAGEGQSPMRMSAGNEAHR